MFILDPLYIILIAPAFILSLVPQLINNPAIPESIFDGHVFSKS